LTKWRKMLSDYRHYECLGVVPYLFTQNVKNVLILGGGNGMLANQIMRFRIRKIDLVEPNASMVEVNKGNPKNNNSLTHCRVFNEGIEAFVKSRKEFYGLILSEYPDPGDEEVDRLYTKEHFNDIKMLLKHRGVFAIKAAAPSVNPNAFWCLTRTIKECFKGFNVMPYQTYLPKDKCEIGYILATTNPLSQLLPNALNYLNQDILKSLSAFGNDEAPAIEIPVSTVENTAYAGLLKPPAIDEYELELEDGFKMIRVACNKTWMGYKGQVDAIAEKLNEDEGLQKDFYSIAGNLCNTPGIHFWILIKDGKVRGAGSTTMVEKVAIVTHMVFPGTLKYFFMAFDIAMNKFLIKKAIFTLPAKGVEKARKLLKRAGAENFKLERFVFCKEMK